MRRLAHGLALASLIFATACGGDSAEPATAPTETAQTEPPAAAASPDSGQSAVLTGTVGTVQDADAPVITLTDDSGQPVTTVPAGQYQIQVRDLSTKHNFHLMGGAVDQSTSVPEVTDTVFDVTLEPGDYTYMCDPHAQRMVGQFSVS
jgi:plastocyanin